MRIKSYDIFNEPQLTIALPDNNAIPSEKNYRIQLTLRPKEFPIFEVKDNKETTTHKVDVIYPLKINVCKLIFTIDNRQTSIDLSNTDLSWRSSYGIVFLKTINKEDIEHLSKWVNNRSLSIGFETKGLAKVDGVSTSPTVNYAIEKLAELNKSDLSKRYIRYNVPTKIEICEGYPSYIFQNFLK